MGSCALVLFPALWSICKQTPAAASIGKRKAKGQKGVQHEDFPGGHPSQYYSRPSTLNCGVLMGSGALVLV
ncbi:hypothetical protein L6164_037454 [Bauhinia variegata]|uniref:Uncharacterized protein n=1 Tax=Bauhinia variegata TaxID=167791 RepID=A0ACB9KK29_BAUVA|nr:hypothetical protein L6164_037454 [Bauhinia variegata]